MPLREALCPPKRDGRDKPGHDEISRPLTRLGPSVLGTLSPFHGERERRRAERVLCTRRESHPSAASSSLSSSSGPARIFSAISPALPRIAASILVAISGLVFRNALAFSRPCQMRCES